MKNNKTMDMILEQMQAITNGLMSDVKQSISSLDKKIDDNHKEVMARLAMMETHIVQPNQVCAAPKNVNTVQYNGVAATLKPIGKCKNSRGLDVDYFGVCKTCGCAILSPSTVAYCMVNKIDMTCYTCQKKVKTQSPTSAPANTAANIHASVPERQPVKDTSMIVACEICGTPRKYASAEDYLNKTNNAVKLGLPKVMCAMCARKKLEEMKANKAQQEAAAIQEPQQYTPDYDNGLSLDDFIEILIEDGKTLDDVTNMKIAQVRTIANAKCIDLAFDGNEWNRRKVECFTSALEDEEPNDELEQPVQSTTGTNDVLDTNSGAITFIPDDVDGTIMF